MGNLIKGCVAAAVATGVFASGYCVGAFGASRGERQSKTDKRVDGQLSAAANAKSATHRWVAYKPSDN